MKIKDEAHAAAVVKAMPLDRIEMLVKRMRVEFGLSDKQARDALRNLRA